MSFCVVPLHSLCGSLSWHFCLTVWASWNHSAVLTASLGCSISDTVWPNSKKSVWKVGLQRKCVYPPKIEATSARWCYRFQINGQVTTTHLLRVPIQKNDITILSFGMFRRPFGPKSRWFQIASSPGILSPYYTYNLLLEDHHLVFFSASHTPEAQVFPTSYPVTKNEFDRTAVAGLTTTFMS